MCRVIFIKEYVLLYICLCTCVCMWVNMQLYMCLYVCTCVRVYISPARASVLPAETRRPRCTSPVPSISHSQRENTAWVAQSVPEVLIYFREGAPGTWGGEGSRPRTEYIGGRATSVAEQPVPVPCPCGSALSTQI